MSTEPVIRDHIEEAAATIGRVWPIHSFVTANPLAGFEDKPFNEAISQASDLLGGRGYPRPEVFESALANNQIDHEILEKELAEAGFEDNPATLLDVMADLESATENDQATDADRVDTVLSKWLSVFLDAGSAHWAMPNREAGFYPAFREMAAYDGEIPSSGVIDDLPKSPLEAIESVLSSYPQPQWKPILEAQLTALPGWAGFIKQRATANDDWQERYPISLEGYLAVRLALVDALDGEVIREKTADENPANALAQAFLRAWERTYREELVEAVAEGSQSIADRDEQDRPEAQLVFCIDTRSEVIRRHIEETGDYKTYGYAGFFGIPMEYHGYDADVAVDSCPPIVDPAHVISEEATDDQQQIHHDRWNNIIDAAEEAMEIMKANAATAYGYVETAGGVYGLSLAARTLLPGRVHEVVDILDEQVADDHEFCEPLVHHQYTYSDDLPVGMTTEEKVEYATTAFESMGWDHWSRLVVFIGHASENANNPFASSLDCGACAGNPGGPNARVMAKICNDPEVKTKLRERGFFIPEDTVFLAGQHNTTTDEVDLYDSDVPESHAEDLEQLREDLSLAGANAATERVESMGTPSADGESDVNHRAADWAETRPEWGLAGNAGFVIGPRELTADVDLDGRTFLHSYDWSKDEDGEALETILSGPLVLTHWINAQYYFSTVDTAVYGSGSKVTQNPVGNIGVYQGNGGDLMTGLPQQSLFVTDDEPYHQPLRLTTVIQAPVDRVNEVLAEHEEITKLLDNNWLFLTVVDPTEDHRVFHYEEALSWSQKAKDPTELQTEAVPHAVGDD